MKNFLVLRIVLISAAAASLGATSLLAWYPSIPRLPSWYATEPPLGIERSMAWMIGAAIFLAFFIFVLGPGIGSL